jgi:hypothetical protein
MIQNGLLQEVIDFHEKIQSSPASDTPPSNDPPIVESFTEEASSGITIAIGYKELLPYIFEVERQKQEFCEDNPTDLNENVKKLELLLESCVERVGVQLAQ